MSYRILVIEDDDGIRSEVLDWLGFEGYDVYGATDGREGIHMAMRMLPDLVISDINMPEMNGYRVLLELRANRATAMTPFIFMTARTTRSDHRYGMEIGAEDYITKPFTNEELLNSVKTQLTKQESARNRTKEQLTELRMALTHSLPHELRTPLIGILGYGELLGMDAEKLSPTSIREMARNIVSSGQRLHHMVENYLLYAQLELLARDPQKSLAHRALSVIRPDSIVIQSANKVAEFYNRTNDIRFDLQSTSAANISEIDLHKIISELVDNAFKFSEPQTPVDVITASEQHEYIVQVTDQGRGMLPEQIQRIGAYTQFQRDIYEQQGVGLGLTISRMLAENYGGNLTIDSTPNMQTSITLRLPVPGM